jgi:hypothetical protein
MNAQEFVNTIDNPVVFFAGVGCPAGQSIAIFEDTELPFGLEYLEGEVKDGIFEANNLTSGPGAYDWDFSDWNCNTIYKIQVYSDSATWDKQHAEYMAQG